MKDHAIFLPEGLAAILQDRCHRVKNGTNLPKGVHTRPDPHRKGRRPSIRRREKGLFQARFGNGGGEDGCPAEHNWVVGF